MVAGGWVHFGQAWGRNFFSREVGIRVRTKLRFSPGAGDEDHHC